VRTLIEYDLVDEVRLTIYPVVLGAGERLLAETSDRSPCALSTRGPSMTALPFSPTSPPKDA
jgi:dihydrofolate reductase